MRTPHTHTHTHIHTHEGGAYVMQIHAHTLDPRRHFTTFLYYTRVCTGMHTAYGIKMPQYYVCVLIYGIRMAQYYVCVLIPLPAHLLSTNLATLLLYFAHMQTQQLVTFECARARTHTHTHTHTYLTGGSVSSFRGAHRPHLGALSVRGEKGHSSYF